MRFKDREHAGEHLAEKLRHLRGRDPLVLAIPSGGVPTACAVAEALGADLDVALVRRLRAPGDSHLTIGAVDEAGDVVVAPVARILGVTHDQLLDEARESFAALRERRRLLADNPPVDPRDRVVVVVDDAIVTGATMLAALRTLRRRGPARLVAAVAVASPDGLARVRLAADETVCAEAPEDFHGAGDVIDDFTPVSDEQALEVLHRFHERRVDVQLQPAPTGSSTPVA